MIVLKRFNSLDWVRCSDTAEASDHIEFNNQEFCMFPLFRLTFQNRVVMKLPLLK